jgi:hypothetical protein
MQADLFAPAATQAKLQPFQAIQSMHAFSADGPALTAQYDDDPLITKPWTGLGYVTNTHPQGRLIFRLTAVIPRRSLHPGQPTCASRAHLKSLMNPVGDLLAANWP